MKKTHKLAFILFASIFAGIVFAYLPNVVVKPLASDMGI